MQQAQAKRRQAFNNLKQVVRIERERVRKLNAAINNYNAAVRTHNNRVRANRQRLNSELNRLRAISAPQRVTYRTTVVHLAESYERMDANAQFRTLSNAENHLYDLAEGEALNSVSLLNALEEDQDQPEAENDATDLQSTAITDEISSLSEDLDRRWRGALFSLNPKNPEAARHFCTSVREVFTGIIELSATDEDVVAALENCQMVKTAQGEKVWRRSKMAYCLRAKGIVNDELEAFADENIKNVLALFDELNGGTHGHSGVLSLTTLRGIKKRVENSIQFLCQIAA